MPCAYVVHIIFFVQVTFFGFYAFWACYLNLFSDDYLELWSFGLVVCKVKTETQLEYRWMMHNLLVCTM